MKSCQGFAHDSFHVVCCLARTCITYTEAAYSGLGNSQGGFELLSCHEREQASAAVSSPGEASGAVENFYTLPTWAALAMLASILL